MYGLSLALHSALRWLLLLIGAAAWWRAWRGWRARGDWLLEDEDMARAVMQLAFVQVALGYILFAELSPVTASALAAPGEAMADPPRRFFLLDHPAAMTLAFLALVVGRVRTRAPEGGPRRHRDWCLALAVAAILALAAIPWPGLSYGRPLWRLPW